MDTSDLPGPARPLPFDPTLAFRATSLPRALARASVSEARHSNILGGLFTGLADVGICAGHSTFDGCCE